MYLKIIMHVHKGTDVAYTADFEWLWVVDLGIITFSFSCFYGIF